MATIPALATRGNPFAPTPSVELPSSATVLLEFPVSVVQGADLAGLQPSGDAVEVEGMLSGCQ